MAFVADVEARSSNETAGRHLPTAENMPVLTQDYDNFEAFESLDTGEDLGLCLTRLMRSSNAVSIKHLTRQSGQVRAMMDERKGGIPRNLQEPRLKPSN